MHNKKIIKSISIVSAFLIFGVLYLFFRYDNKSDEFLITADTEAVTKEQDTSVGQIYVYVCGAVNNPGVYCMPPDSRMFEAIEMAGGVREDAGTGHLELAREVVDGQRIYVPTNLEESLSVLENVTQGLININTATKEQLMMLPGIGEARADAIISYRNTKGGFNSIDELMNISGIKDAAFQKIKERICT